jgi:hypothetical protein
MCIVHIHTYIHYIQTYIHYIHVHSTHTRTHTHTHTHTHLYVPASDRACYPSRFSPKLHNVTNGQEELIKFDIQAFRPTAGTFSPSLFEIWFEQFWRVMSDYTESGLSCCLQTRVFSKWRLDYYWKWRISYASFLASVGVTVFNTV